MDGLLRVSILKKALYKAAEAGWTKPPGFCVTDFIRDAYHSNSPHAGRELLDLRFCVALWPRAEAEKRLAELKACQDVAEYLLNDK
jgi:hypothetical protein